jgi:hypothetical protein
MSPRLQPTINIYLEFAAKFAEYFFHIVTNALSVSRSPLLCASTYIGGARSLFSRAAARHLGVISADIALTTRRFYLEEALLGIIEQTGRGRHL